MIDDEVKTEAEKLASARLAWPDMRAQELEAEGRLIEAILCGDIQAGAKAIADAIDARCAMRVWYDHARRM